MDTAQVRSLLGRLAEARPVFHNEADFQHAYAWLLHLEHPEARVRLEWRSPAEQRASIDLYAELDGRRIAVEFKYLTRSLEVDVDGERFALRNHGAQDLGRYDSIKDVVRLERLVSSEAVDAAWAVLLSNDDSYWAPRRSTGTIDAAFGLHDGARLAGNLSWATHAGGTTRGREAAHELVGSYDCLWAHYSTITDRPGGTFRYLCLPISAKASKSNAPAAGTAEAERPVASSGSTATEGTAREHLLAAIDRLRLRHARDTFDMAEIVQEALAGGAPQAESTLRTHIGSVMCVNAPANHAVRWPDLERVGGGRYRRVPKNP